MKSPRQFDPQRTHALPRTISGVSAHGADLVAPIERRGEPCSGDKHQTLRTRVLEGFTAARPASPRRNPFAAKLDVLRSLEGLGTDGVVFVGPIEQKPNPPVDSIVPVAFSQTSRIAPENSSSDF